MAGRIQLRRGTAANWTSANPTLASGEVGVETDTGKFKVGNGSTAWTSLGYNDAGSVGHIAAAVDAHDASAISVLDTAGNYTGTNVESVLAELPGKFGIAVGAPGGTDDTALFVAAEALLPAAGGLLVLSAGTYALPSGHSFAKRVRLVGQGMGNPYNSSGATFPDHRNQRGITTIICSSATATALTFTVDGSSAADFAVVNTNAGTVSAGAGIATTLADLFTLDRVAVVGFYDCVDIDNGGMYAVRGCWIGNPVRYGVRLRNVALPDEGDGFIGDGTAIYCTTRDATAGINWESGGGIKLNGVKINGNTASGSNFGSGIRFNTATGVSSSVCTITGCSIENTTVAINFERQGASGTFASVTIVGNELGVGSGGSNYGVLMQSDGFTNVVIDDNVITDIAFPIIVNWGTGINIGSGNTYRNVGNGANQGAVTVGANSVGVIVHPQHVYENDYITIDNSAAATPAMIDYDYNYSLGTISGSATTLWRLLVPANNAGTIDVEVSGNAVGVGAFQLRAVRSYSRTSGAVTVATVWTDVEVGGTTGVALTFDTAAVSGEVQVKIATAGGASDIDGVVHMKVNGRLSSLKRGA
jgi:hypothetical protein